MSSGHPPSGPPMPLEDDRPPPRRSRSRSPPRGRGRRRSRSRTRSRSRSRSPPGFRGGRRSRSPPPRRGPKGGRGRSRSRSWSGSRSPSPRAGRLDRDRDYRPGGFRDRGPPPGPGGYGPPDDLRGGFQGRGRGPPPYGEPPFDRIGPGGGGSYGPPGRGPPPARRGERRRRDEGPPGVSLLVRNVAPSITTEDLQMAFGRIGEVRDVYIPRDYHSQQPKGFAFIEYANPDMAREARDEMDRFRIKGRELEVVFAQERRKTPNEMRGRPGSDPRAPAEFERSSSFERHRQRQREGGRDRDRDRRRDNGDRRDPEARLSKGDTGEGPADSAT